MSPRADRTMMCAYGNLAVAALQLEALRDRGELVAGADDEFSGWAQSVGQALEHFERIQLTLMHADQITNTLPLQLGNGATVPADAAYLDRISARMRKLRQIGVLRGYADTIHARVGGASAPAARSESVVPLAAAS
ncbi:hypothetical protein [Schumannella sp. 10F1B-5-1]|uniref:hypothetical protein n=1 Tax=Schumannella sp. 10F1B-5-1 TaxID=2590780 RepID=UPI001130BBA7|nr:hypothetical protein [Schumannella sp. 10F1B-5-1]TPW78338.1 hypothetical protein FJ658_00580 [Schumannella sp. 10F1B-5-1]